jgi:hypothetical protein
MRFRAHIVGAPLHGTASFRGATAALLTWRSTRGAGRRPPPPARVSEASGVCRDHAAGGRGGSPERRLRRHAGGWRRGQATGVRDG